MGILDGLFKRQPKAETGTKKRQLTMRQNPYESANNAIQLSAFSHFGKQMNCDHGKQKELKNIIFDPCVNAAVNTRLEGLCNMRIVVDSENESLNDFIKAQLEPLVEEVVKISVWSDLLGFNIGELVWREEGNLLVIDQVYNRDYSTFIPLPDGKNVIVREKGKYKVNYEQSDIAPYGKYLLCVNEGCPENPHGLALFQCLYYLVQIRTFGYRSWAKWLERFGQPFLHGKLGACTDEFKQYFMEQLDCALDASSIVTDKDSDIEVIEAAGGKGDHFKIFNDCIKKEIQQSILGQNLTSEVSNTGSLAAAQVHDGIRNNKVKSDARKVNKALRTLVDFIKIYNNIDEDITVTLEEKDGIEMDRAQRDALLVKSGILSLTPEYLLRTYDYKEGDIESPQNQLIAQLRSTGRTTELQNQKNVNALDDLVALLDRQKVDAFNIDELFSVIETVENQENLFDELANFINDSETVNFEELLTRALYYSLHEGVDSHGRR